MEGRGPVDQLVYCREDSLQCRSFLFFTLKNSRRQKKRGRVNPDWSSVSCSWAGRLTCDGRLPALAWTPESVAPSPGHIQVLLATSG